MTENNKVKVDISDEEITLKFNGEQSSYKLGDNNKASISHFMHDLSWVINDKQLPPF